MAEKMKRPPEKESVSSDTALVSILMPAYNAEKFIRQAIRSIVEQRYAHWELLILDDGSTDSTAAVIGSFNDPRISTFSHQRNLGYLQSCNTLFEAARGDILTFLDADDTCPKERLSTCTAFLQKNPQVDLLTTDHSRTDEEGKTVSEHRTTVDYHRYATDAAYYPTICCATIMVRKQLLKKVGGYSPFFEGIGGEDYHWLFRLSRAGSGRHLGQVLYYYRRHKDQLHLTNQNVLKYFAMEMDQDLRRELIAGKDLLTDPENLRLKWQTHIEKHPQELRYRIASSLMNRGERMKCLRYSFSIVSASPFSIRAWYLLLYLWYSMLVR